jgi:Fe2+ or Zn2+ uptake regulation protein
MDDDVAAVTQAIAAYLLANPQASDTAIGIARWWLPDDAVSMDTVIAALNWMTDQEIIEARAAADGRTRYRRSCPDDMLLRLAGSAGGNGGGWH